MTAKEKLLKLGLSAESAELFLRMISEEDLEELRDPGDLQELDDSPALVQSKDLILKPEDTGGHSSEKVLVTFEQ